MVPTFPTLFADLNMAYNQMTNQYPNYRAYPDFFVGLVGLVGIKIWRLAMKIQKCGLKKVCKDCYIYTVIQDFSVFLQISIRHF